MACCTSLVVAGSISELVGTFTSRPSREDFGTDSVVEDLQITVEADTYGLHGTMNVTNREPGMDHTSNTFWSWTGDGRLVDGVINFTCQKKFAGGPPKLVAVHFIVQGQGIS